MIPFREFATSVADIGVLWFAATVVWLYLSVRLARRLRGARLWRLVRNDRGAGYSVPLVLVVPVYTLLVCTVIECTLMLTVKLATTYAAYASARAAVVWLPAEIPPERRRGMIHLAAINAMWPFASGSRDHATAGEGTFVPDERAAQACIAAYRAYSGGRAPEDYLMRKWRYAAKATNIEISSSSDDFNAQIQVTVEYEMPLNIPGVGRFLGRRASWPGAAFYTRRIASSATLELEGHKSTSGRLGIDYYVDHGFSSAGTLGIEGVESYRQSRLLPSSDIPDLDFVPEPIPEGWDEEPAQLDDPMAFPTD